MEIYNPWGFGGWFNQFNLGFISNWFLLMKSSTCTRFPTSTCCMRALWRRPWGEYPQTLGLVMVGDDGKSHLYLERANKKPRQSRHIFQGLHPKMMCCAPPRCNTEHAVSIFPKIWQFPSWKAQPLFFEVFLFWCSTLAEILAPHLTEGNTYNRRESSKF